MRWDVALYDIVAPYLLRGAPLGPIHAAISAIFVSEYDVAVSSTAVAIRGKALLSGEVGGFFDPSNGTFGVNAQNVEGHPRDDAGRRDPWIDLRDTHIAFSLTALRTASAIVNGGAAGLSQPDDADIIALLDALDTDPADPPPSDYPSTEFQLDMVITGAVLRPPFLKGARLLDDGRLVPIGTDAQVELTLPRFKLRLAQGSNIGDPLTIDMLSVGASGLDDPSDLGVAELIRMEPPYAFIGDSHQVGIGFRRAVLDLSDGSTPFEILDQFGFDEAWTGLYLPEIRLFVAPNGMEDFAVSAGVRNLLIGWGAQGGVTGDFDLAVIDQGSGELHLGARFVDAEGRAFGITSTGDSTAEAAVPAQTRMIIDVQSGRPPYTTSVDLGNGPLANQRVVDVDISGAVSRTVTISANDSRSPPLQQTLTITLRQRTPQFIITPGGPVQPVQILVQQSSDADGNIALPEAYIVSQSTSHAVIGLRPPSPDTDWSQSGIGEIESNSVTARFEIGPGETIDISATVDPPPGPSVPLTAYFHFDEPATDRTDFDGYVIDPTNTNTQPAVDEPPQTGWLGGGPVIPAFENLLENVSAGTLLTITGTASFEGNASNSKQRYNYVLSRNRAEALRRLIEQRFPGRFAFNIEPAPALLPEQSPPAPWVADWSDNANPRNRHWQATTLLPGAAQPTTDTTVTLRRPPSEPATITEVPDEPPGDPSPPSWFRSAALKVRIVRNSFVALEVSGELDFQTAVEERVTEGGVSAGDVPTLGGLGHQNPADGIVAYQLLIQVDDAAQTWSVNARLGADPADIDGLLMTGNLPGATSEGPNTGRNFLGITTAMAPVLATTAPSDPLNGDIGAIVLSGAAIGLPLALAELGWFSVERVTLYGGQAIVKQRTSGPETSFLFDVETAISASITLNDFELLTIPREAPLVVRYKAIGVRLGYTPPETRFQFRPVFDSSQGYTIEVGGPGGLRVADPIGRILQVLAARLARTNPMNFEIDIGFSVDLGVVSVDRARVRIPLSPVGPPELTALAASIDIPGVLRAQGYLEIGTTTGPSGGPISEIRGGLDMTLVPIKLRIKAELAIADIPESEGGPATGVVVSIEVTFPVAIPLGNSGLGLLGLLGLFAMHYGRNETAAHLATPTPALAWLQATGGEPTKLSEGGQHFWTPQIDRWAFGVGAVLGTVEGGTLFNLKGVFLLELPGPRILLMMKAAILTPPPAIKGVEEAGGSVLAVIDLDAGRGTLTIGLIAQYGIEPLVEIRIPIEAFFNLKKSAEWHIFLGKFDDPIQARVISAFEGSGYFMISGNGITGSDRLEPIPTGLAVATGMHVELIWGNKQIRIYASVAGGFDAIVGFQPFFLQGNLYFRGELRLVIIGISAYAGLDLWLGKHPETGLKIARIEGKICGKIDLFFFSIEGCVDFGLGEMPTPLTPPLPTGMRLVSRGPALIVGSGADQPIDAVLADAIESDDAPADDVLPANPSTNPNDEDFVAAAVVPIDAILVFSLSAPPQTDGATVLGETIGDAPGSKPDGFIERGRQSYRYKIASVSLIEGDLGAGEVPVVWWSERPATDPNNEVQLAVLTWTPNATPAAVERSEFLEERITDRWGVVCHDTAPAAPVLWAFHDQPVGPSADGWMLSGKAWPDPPDTERSSPPDIEVRVSESWRSGLDDIDAWRGIYPAWVEAALVSCEGACGQFGGGVNPGVDFEGSDDIVFDPVRVIPTPDSNPGVDRVSPGIGIPPVRPDQPIAAGRNELRNTLSAAGDTIADTTIADARSTSDNEVLRLRRAMDAFTVGRGEDIVVDEQVTPNDAIRRLRLGEPLARNVLLDAVRDRSLLGFVNRPPSTTVPPQKQCAARVLSMPMLDHGAVVALGDKTKTDEIQKAWESVGYQQSPLANAVQLHTGGIAGAALLLACWRTLLELKVLVVRVLDADGGELARITATNDDLVPPKPLPSRWINPNGPWCRDVDRAMRFAPSFTDSDGRYPLVLIDLGEFPNAEKLEIGLDFAAVDDGGGRAIDTLTAAAPATHALTAIARTKFPLIVRWFYLLCFEITRFDEAAREAYDEQLIETDREAVGRYLGLDSGGYAMLRPATRYGVRITWEQERRDADGVTGGVQPDQKRTYWFRTADTPPARMAQYLMFSLPNEREQHVFGEEPLKLVFATPQVVNLYAAYGRDLQVRLRAASFRQPDPADLPPGESYPFPLSPTTMEELAPMILTPFEQALQEHLDDTCIPIAEERVRHSARTIIVPLDPLTDYILDIETVPSGQPDNGDRVIVHTVSFSTGRYPTLESFAVALQTVRERHRWIESGVMQAIGAAFAARDPQGAEFDSALIDAGLEPMPVPDAPRQVVFWEQASPGATPQPVAVLIDAPEPMRRFWQLPTETVDDSVEPQSTRWETLPQAWLDLAPGSDTPARINTIVRAPGGQRALVVLRPGSRGQRVQVDLVRQELSDHFVDPAGSVDQHFPIFDLVLNRAPWEE